MPSFPHRASGPSTPPLPFLTSARAGALFLDERGAATAEYAVATMATVEPIKRVRASVSGVYETLWSSIYTGISSPAYRGVIMARQPYPARTIAEWFLAWAEGEQEAVLSNLKLQKLLYYAQGHYLARNHSKLFAEDIQAWGHGPVVKPIYHEYKRYGSDGIPSDPGFSFSEVDGKTTKFLVSIWDTFGSKTAWKLREMTHNEKPWRSTYDEGVREKVIPVAVIEDYFAGLYAARARGRK